MVGSYGPKAEPHEFLTPVDEAPSGMLLRGTYKSVYYSFSYCDVSVVQTRHVATSSRRPAGIAVVK